MPGAAIRFQSEPACRLAHRVSYAWHRRGFLSNRHILNAEGEKKQGALEDSTSAWGPDGPTRPMPDPPTTTASFAANTQGGMWS